MRALRTIAALSMPAFTLLLFSAQVLSPARATPETGMTLLSTLAEWQYPGSRLPGGASMSDGGNPQLQSVKCQAILTTSDPIEKVIAFYAEKFGTAPIAAAQASKALVNEADARSVSDQDDSGGRPVTVRVLVVNKLNTSTTLVISRADAEKETHIAWSHYVRLGGQR